MWLKLKNPAGEVSYVNLAQIEEVERVGAIGDRSDGMHLFFASAHQAEITDPESMQRLAAALDWWAAEGQAVLAKPSAYVALGRLLQAAETVRHSATGATLHALAAAAEEARKAVDHA